MSAVIFSAIYFIAVILPVFSIQQFYYVKSNDSQETCPYRVCLTFNQYVRRAATYFTTGSTFLFSPGNHSLSLPLKLSHVSNITLMGNLQSNFVVMDCSENYAFLCENVKHLSIQNLIFSSRCNLSYVFKILSSTSEFSDVVFWGRYKAGALELKKL